MKLHFLLFGVAFFLRSYLLFIPLLHSHGDCTIPVHDRYGKFDEQMSGWMD